MFTGIRHLANVLTVPPTKACLLCGTPVGMDLYIQVHARRLLPSAVPWISEIVYYLIESSAKTMKVRIPWYRNTMHNSLMTTTGSDCTQGKV